MFNLFRFNIIPHDSQYILISQMIFQGTENDNLRLLPTVTNNKNDFTALILETSLSISSS